mmetsp:Transcript_112734/g.168697  ORF Transcript_112734/g.168697 Transcript_112734/m.168697 type:complete len:201 (+) Transcript_112734:187-789(+)
MGTSAPQTRSMGASKKLKVSVSMIMAAISEPTPCCGHPCSTVTQRPVFSMDFKMASRSKGRMDNRLITSAEIPLAAKASAASRQIPTGLEKEIMVTSVPSRSNLAFPKGITQSFDCASSDIGKEVPYMSSCSKTTTGLGSRIAALMSPLASSDEYGATTLSPGTLPYHAAKHCECCAAVPAEYPFGPRKTIGHAKFPPLM